MTPIFRLTELIQDNEGVSPVIIAIRELCWLIYCNLRSYRLELSTLRHIITRVYIYIYINTIWWFGTFSHLVGNVIITDEVHHFSEG